MKTLKEIGKRLIQVLKWVGILIALPPAFFCIACAFLVSAIIALPVYIFTGKNTLKWMENFS